MSKNDQDKIVVVLKNTDLKVKIWDSPEGGQGRRREGSLPDSIRFGKDCSVGMTADQAARMGKLPAGVVAESYDPKKHRNVKKMG